MTELTEQAEVPSLLERLFYYHQEIGMLNMLLILISLGASLYITVKTKSETREKNFRSICIITLVAVGWLILNTGVDLVRCFNYSTTNGKMPIELILTNIGERAFQIQATGLHMIVSGALLLRVHLKKEKV